ncbi:MAG TPA: hypothetical protein VNI78_01860, partial [Vicinamibacterales bacterium]|nr:hypothetical protein [Vicinamibacterales bacterium]
GPIYAGEDGESRKGTSQWMPRVSAAYLLGDRTVVKGGYGLYYDVLTAADYDANRTGYSVTTTSTISDDLGRTFKWATPATGASSFDPFPIRADGTRFDSPVGDTLGVNTLLGQNLFTENGLREHSRQQRWRISVQRELSPRLSLEVAYTGAFTDKVPISIRQDYLPQQYWNSSNERNTAAQTFLNAQVPNPYFIGNFEELRTSNPVLYQRLASQPTFASRTIARHRLLRPFGFMTNLTYSNLPLGSIRAHTLEVVVNRRFANGLSGFASFSANSVRENRIVEEFDRVPTLWQGSNGGRPWRATAAGVYDLPFGRGQGPLSALVRGWQISGTWEYQPGPLLNWNTNLFFYGDIKDIKVDKPTLERWINVDAGFERDPARAPAAFQTRSFPFRIDGVRGQALMFTNLSIMRSFRAGGSRTWQLRVDAQNVFNRQQWQGPNLDPTSTNFGRVTNVALNQMRFFTFGARMTF